MKKAMLSVGLVLAIFCNDRIWRGTEDDLPRNRQDDGSMLL